MRWPKDQAQGTEASGGGMTENMKLMEFAFRMGQGSIQPPVAPSMASGTPPSQVSFPALAEKPLPLPIMDDPNRNVPQEVGTEKKQTLHMMRQSTVISVSRLISDYPDSSLTIPKKNIYRQFKWVHPSLGRAGAKQGDYRLCQRCQ